ncbi:MAG: rhodanese-like domain-containing protein [Chitinophagaceae bacterium]|nr:rhodanese-like domain-containing protein [Chitinophagaceae bacterium]MBK8951386.1 rhodanese-like domain-containing protein [Chitinophagaceae bacterium]
MSSLKELVKNPSTIIVDVRSPWEYEMEHIPGAKNIPLDQIPYKTDEFRLFKNPVVVYCRSGARSSMAASILAQNGIANVYNGGGIGDMQFLIN